MIDGATALHRDPALAGPWLDRVATLAVAMACAALGIGLTLEGVASRMWPALFEAQGPTKWARWAVCYSWVSYGWLLFFYPVGTVARMTQESILWLLGG